MPSAQVHRLQVYFMQTDGSHENARLKIRHGSFYFCLTFTPIYMLFSTVYGPSLFPEFARVTACLNEMIDAGVYGWGFSEWYALNHAVWHSKKLWKHFFCSIGEESYLEHPALSSTLWETLRPSQFGCPYLHKHLDSTLDMPFGKASGLCESEVDDIVDEIVSTTNSGKSSCQPPHCSEERLPKLLIQI